MLDNLCFQKFEKLRNLRSRTVQIEFRSELNLFPIHFNKLILKLYLRKMCKFFILKNKFLYT